MPTFTSTREAKEFLIGQIVQEAQEENVSLSETERKMLCFSETAWTLPDMDQVSAEFDRDCDQDEYEQKIGSLVANLRERLKKDNADELKSWDTAVRQLSNEDHYLLVLIDAGRSVPNASGSPWWSYALGGAAILLITIFSMRSCH